MYYIYLLRSKHHPKQIYVGLTTNIKKRLQQHNESSNSHHTKKYQPWHLVGFMVLFNKEKAYKFEKYLKSGSGWEFARRHFW